MNQRLYWMSKDGIMHLPGSNGEDRVENVPGRIVALCLAHEELVQDRRDRGLPQLRYHYLAVVDNEE